MTPAEIRRLIRAYQQGKVVLHHYRGRVGLDPHTQAAEHFWREQTGNLGLPGMQIDLITEMGKNSWEITVCDTNGENCESIRLQQRLSDYNIPITCSKKKSGPISSFHRLG